MAQSGYDIHQLIALGGAGAVYLAEERASGRVVALKKAREGMADATALFADEIRKASQLGHHPHIVHALASGKDETGQAFLVMEYMAGGTLAEAVELGAYSERRAALHLMCKIARAVQHAHGRAILHCDLKPANILFDEDGEPHVADFGLARRVEAVGEVRGESWGGTRGWMSPEQARLKLGSECADREALGVASDVFSLGVLMYWLLAGHLPFGNGIDFEQRLQSDAAPLLVPSTSGELDWELAVICRQAMAKDPAQRYRSAAEFADDIERALSGSSIAAERSMLLRRAAKWMSRHRALTFFGLLFLLVITYLPVMPFLVLSELDNLLREQNSRVVVQQADAVALELRSFAARIREAALDPEVVALVTHSDLDATPEALAQYGRSAGDIDNLIVFSRDGDIRARWPRPRRLPAVRNFAFRDYFRGAAQLGQQGEVQPYVSRVIRGHIDATLELEIAVPLLAHDGEFVGVIAGARRARTTFGSVQMNCSALGGPCMTALLAPRDRDLWDGPAAEGLIVLAAPNLESQTEVALDPALSRTICQHMACTPTHQQFEPRPMVEPLVMDYVDPLTGAHQLGAFAPVGGTGLSVVVATPGGAAKALGAQILSKALSVFWLPLLVVTGLLVACTISLRKTRPLP